jgi:hypothetical protein
MYTVIEHDDLRLFDQHQQDMWTNSTEKSNNLDRKTEWRLDDPSIIYESNDIQHFDDNQFTPIQSIIP